MRTFLALVGLVALIVLGLVWAGFLNLNATPGSLPHVEVKGGQAPTLKADMGTVDLGTTNKTVEVPTVGTTEKQVTVPTLSVKGPSEPAK